MIGLDLSDRSIKLVRLTNRSPRKLLSHCWHVVPEGVMERGVIQQPQALKEILLAIFEQCSISPKTSDPVVASIPEMQSFMRVIDVPVMAEDEISEAIQWQVAQHMPFGLENVYLDWQPVKVARPRSDGQKEVLVGAAQKRVVDPLLKVLDEMSIDLAALELESQALVRALVSPDLVAHQGLLIVDVGGAATNVVVHDQGAMRFTAILLHGVSTMSRPLSDRDRRQLDTPGKRELAPDLAGQISQKVKGAQEELVSEIKGVVEFYNGIDKNHEVKEILLTGGGSNYPGLDQVFLKYFDDVHVQRGNPWVNLLATGSSKDQMMSLRESVHFATAIGLALRELPY